MATTASRRLMESSIAEAVAKARSSRVAVLEIGETEPGQRWYCIQSRTHPDKGYLLKVEDGRVCLCTCLEFEQSRFCWHRVRLALDLGTVPTEWLARYESNGQTLVGRDIQ